MKIFLTGGTGYLGTNFINYALKQNHKIYAISRRRKNSKRKNLFWLRGRIDNNWQQLKQCDVLVHLASEGVYNKYASFKKCYNFNVRASLRLLENCVKYKCSKWILIGSCFEKRIKNFPDQGKEVKKKRKMPFYNYALSKYIFTKKSLEIAKKNKVKCRVLRLFHVYGKNEHKDRLWPSLINAAKKNKNFYMTKGDQIRDFCYIDNVIISLLEALNFQFRSKNFPQSWDFATGKKKSVKQFAREIWKKYESRGKLIFNKITDNNDQNYIANKKKLWKISSYI